MPGLEVGASRTAQPHLESASLDRLLDKTKKPVLLNQTDLKSLLSAFQKSDPNGPQHKAVFEAVKFVCDHQAQLQPFLQKQPVVGELKALLRASEAPATSEPKAAQTEADAKPVQDTGSKDSLLFEQMQRSQIALVDTPQAQAAQIIHADDIESLMQMIESPKESDGPVRQEVLLQLLAVKAQNGSMSEDMSDLLGVMLSSAAGDLTPFERSAESISQLEDFFMENSEFASSLQVDGEGEFYKTILDAVKDAIAAESAESAKKSDAVAESPIGESGAAVEALGLSGVQSAEVVVASEPVPAGQRLSHMSEAFQSRVMEFVLPRDRSKPFEITNADLGRLAEIAPSAGTGHSSDVSPNREIVDNMLEVISFVRTHNPTPEVSSALDRLEARYHGYQSQLESGEPVVLPKYYHATTLKGVGGCLSARVPQINVGGEGGTWVSSSPLLGMGDTKYGDYAIVMGTPMEGLLETKGKYETLPGQQWYGVSHAIPVNSESVAYIVVPDDKAPTADSVFADYKKVMPPALRGSYRPPHIGFPVVTTTECVVERQLMNVARSLGSDRADALVERGISFRMPTHTVSVSEARDKEVLICDAQVEGRTRSDGAVQYGMWDAGRQMVAVINPNSREVTYVKPDKFHGLHATGQFASSKDTFFQELVNGQLHRS